MSEFMAGHVASILGVSPEAAYADRRNHRELWFREIAKFQEDDPGKIVRSMLEVGDVINGARHRKEFEPVKDLFDLRIWVARDVPVDPTMELHVSDCHVVLDNNGTLEDLDRRVADLVDALDHPQDHR